jgi:hypothetical protein
MAETTPRLNQATDAGSHNPKSGTESQPIDFMKIYQAEVAQRQAAATTVSDTGPPSRRVETRLESNRTGGSPESAPAVNPYKQLQLAENAATEIKSLAGKKPTDIVTYTENGKTEQCTVAQRTAELQKVIHQQGTEAIAAADRIIQTGPTSPAAQRAAVEPTRQELASRTGYGPNADIDMKDLIKRLDSPNLTPELRRDLEDLKTVQTKSNDMMALEHAQEITRLLNAKFRSEGLLDPPDASGNFKASQPSIIDAFQLVREASRLGVDGALSSTPDFQQLSETVNKQFGQFQSQNFKAITDDITLADSLKIKNPAAADAIFKDAMKKADQTDIAYIASLIPTQSDQTVQTQLIQMIQTTESARLDYATFLNKQGRHDEALPLLTRAQAEAAPLVQKDPTFFQEMNKALYSNAGADSTLSANDYAQQINDLMQHGKYNEAGEALAKMKALTQAQMQAQKDVPALTQEKQRVDAQMALLGKDASGDDQYAATQRALLTNEQAQLGNELQTAAKAQFANHFTDLLEGELNRVMGGSDHNKIAQNCYEKFAAEEPAYAKAINIAQLQDAVASHSVFSVSGVKELGCAFAATAIGLGTGVAAAALTAWSGPLAGVAGFAAGTAVGSATYAGLEHYVMGKDLSARLFIEGAGYSLGGTLMYFTAGASAGYEGGAGLAGRAMTFGVTRMAPIAANAVVVNGTQMGTTMYYDKKDFSHAGMEFATSTSLDMMLGFLPAPKIAKSFVAPSTEAFVAGMRESFGKTALSSAERTVPDALRPRNLAPNLGRTIYDYGVVRGPGGNAVIASGMLQAKPYLQQVPQLRPVVGDPAAEQEQRVTQSPLGPYIPEIPTPENQ